MTESFIRRTWVDVDLDKLKSNYRTAKSLTQSTVTCVLKANAYGHGAVRVAQALAEEGCESFAVSCVREGLQLRQAGVHGEILVMGLTEPEALEAAILARLTLTVSTSAELAAMEHVCAAMHQTVCVHLKADTGFHRLGMDCTEQAADEMAAAAAKLTHVRVDGLYSHLGLINKERDEMQHGAGALSPMAHEPGTGGRTAFRRSAFPQRAHALSVPGNTDAAHDGGAGAPGGGGGDCRLWG